MFRILTVHGWKYFKKFKINQNYIRLAHIFVTFGHDIGLAFAETLLTSLKSKDFLSISGKQLWRQTRICLLSLRFFFFLILLSEKLLVFSSITYLFVLSWNSGGQKVSSCQGIYLISGLNSLLYFWLSLKFNLNTNFMFVLSKN